MNHKKVRDAIDKVFERISKMPPDEFKSLIKKTPNKWGSFLLRGGFINSTDGGGNGKDQADIIKEKFP